MHDLMTKHFLRYVSQL